MFSLVQSKMYRPDIDGLRAVAVLAVIFFHFGHLPNGFLGVDVFFVISGFLITGIIYKEMHENRFSVLGFYLRRTRRILPLALFVGLVALLVGMLTMLPDDLENLAQSIIATNFFSNNVLQAMTTKNYWDVLNEYKPLMHTWSLGVEEQFYLFYPFFMLLLGGRRGRWFLPCLVLLTVTSLILYLLPGHQEFQKFYLIHFRFWELAVGGIAAIALQQRIVSHRYAALPILLLGLLLCFELPFLTHQTTLLAVVFTTLLILIAANARDPVASFLLENKLCVQVGKISFSLYMWHQVVLAYSRYAWSQELHASHLTAVLVSTFVFSVLSYIFVEQPFRDRKRVTTKMLLWVVGGTLLVTTVLSLVIYFRAGVIRDVPELGIAKATAARHMHAQYNDRIRSYDVEFHAPDKMRVLVIGNSFARDWVNVLLESQHKEGLEISYVEDVSDNTKVSRRSDAADVIFYATPTLQDVRKAKIDESKLWVVGTKNFGTSNGIFYNYRGADYYQQRAEMENRYLAINQSMRQEWGARYVDYIAKVIDAEQRVPVFTPSRQFISQDCRHLTQAGAQYFAQLFHHDLAVIFKTVRR